MKVEFTQVGGWNGGEWRYNGLSKKDFMKTYGFDPTVVKGMVGVCHMLGWDHPIVVSSETNTIRGTDHDHGHEYHWSYEEPTFIFDSPGLPPLPAGLIWKQNGIITLEMS